jgi:inner membrane protein
MDIITQGLLGGAMAQTVAQAPEVRRNMLIGVFAGLAADADVFISSTQDPLLTLEYHRQFTHSLLFIPFGALIVAGILWLFLRNKMPFLRIYLVCLLGYSLSGFIDACTSYGTQLLWPLSDKRIAFNIISIVDPLFTGPLLLLLLVALFKQQRQFAFIALAWCGFYLLFGAMQHERAVQLATQLITSRGQSAQTLVVKPTFGNLLVWRSLYINDQQIHIDGLRVGFGRSEIYVGETLARLDIQRDFAGLPKDSIQIDDIKRFSQFSNDFVAVHPDKSNVVGDMRYSLLPNSRIPLWGIELNEQQPQQHARFITFRHLDSLVRQQFLDMLTGSYPGTTIE